MMILYVSLILAAVVVVVVWRKLYRVFAMFQPTLPEGDYGNPDDLPSVSLCIPARNEVHAMTSCLESALQSRYPKLEIIVLDDGSRDDTGHLIKAFAHSGVRFVEGSPLPDDWLGKNHALHKLLGESSGSLVLFADVDTIFSAQSIDRMVGYMTRENADMVSVLPYRHVSKRASAAIATLRHFWSLVGHTKTSPATASNAWMIRRSVIEQEFGGFNTIKSAVRPEKVIAQALSAKSRYRFIISDSTIGISYEKKLSSQYETSVRIYYPDFGLQGILWRISGLLAVLLPYAIVIFGIVTHHFALAAIAAVVIAALIVLNAWYLRKLHSHQYGIASLCLPYIIAREIVLLAASVILYRRRKVTWKGRPVSIR